MLATNMIQISNVIFSACLQYMCFKSLSNPQQIRSQSCATRKSEVINANEVPHLDASTAMEVSQELKAHYDLTKEAARGQLPDGIRSLTQLWTEMVSTSLRKLELPDYVAFCEARGLPREWLGKDGSVEHMKLENVLHLATEIEALGSSCTPIQVLSDFESKFR